MTTGERIKEYRKKNNLTQSQLAKKVNVSSQVVSNWEREYTSPSKDDIANLSRVLGVSSEYLICNTDDPIATTKQNNLNKQSDLKEKDIEEIIDDPQLGLWFKAGKETTPENRKKALEFLKFIEEQEKDRKPGDKQK